MKLEWSKYAFERIAQIHDDIASEQPAAAKQIVTRIADTAELIRKYPGVARPIRRSSMFVFAIPRTKYLILVRIDRETVTVASVVHGAEDWKSRMSSIPLEPLP